MSPVVPGRVRAVSAGNGGSFAAFGRDAGVKGPTGRTARRSFSLYFQMDSRIACPSNATRL